MADGMVFDISRYCLDDGPGIRTTVFLKGCPLKCIWCHNPESLSKSVEIGFEEKKCVSCGACVMACPNQCHKTHNGMHLFHRDNCIACSKCVEACEFDSLTLIGEKMTVEQVIKIIERDRPFYQSSGGGLTLSGGEALFQPEFTTELLMEAKKKDISTCIETSGYASENKIMKIAQYADLFLFDCKHMDSCTHKKVTGVDNELILNNLRQLDTTGKDIVLRLPLIPDINDNDSHFARVGELADSLDNILYLEVMPYHPLGLSKASMLNKKMLYAHTAIPESIIVDNWVAKIQKYTLKKVIRSKS